MKKLAFAACLVCLAVPASAGVEWLPPRIDGAGIVVVPNVHYSSENEFGLSLEAVRPFRTPMQSSVSADSEIRVLGRMHTTGNATAEAVATIFFGEGAWSLKSRIEYESLARRFWGVGADTPDAAEEVYRPQNVLTYVELFRRVFDRLRVGARMEWQDYRYLEIEDGGLLDTRDYPGLCCDNATGGGLVWEWDGRDNVYSPTRGIYAQGFALFFSEDLNGDYAFRNVHFDVRSYHDLGGGNVLALQVFTYALFGDAPIWRYAAVGGRAHSRGYRRGRYLDRRMAAVQAEWRFPLVGRLDGVAFGGLANADEYYNDFKFERMRPTLGGGLRLPLNQRRDVTVRADLAFGESSMRGYLAFGHAF